MVKNLVALSNCHTVAYDGSYVWGNEGIELKKKARTIDGHFRVKYTTCYSLILMALQYGTRHTSSQPIKN
jgi:hypothetical protein